ncbi:hypothetical protein BC834DRAFT_965815 [Gloeopeniophorella convolvens]|nr:hypothetical protein BC834DRAFT_965815 [Gloeopeniophorella convolvens]
MSNLELANPLGALPTFNPKVQAGPSSHRPRMHAAQRHLDRRPPLYLPVEIISSILEAGYHTHDLQQDTKCLLNACLISRGWSLVAQKLLFCHVVIRSQKAYASFHAAVYEQKKGLAECVRSLGATLDPAQPGGLRSSFFAYAVSLCPNLATLDLACYAAASRAVRGGLSKDRSYRVLPDEVLATLRPTPHITTLRLANWSGDPTLLSTLLQLLPALRTLALRGTLTSFTSPPCGVPLPERLVLEPSLASTLLAWLAQPSLSSPVRALEFTRQPEPTVLAALLHAHGSALCMVTLPTLPTASAELFACCSSLCALRIEHPFSALPPCARVRHAALALGPALVLLRTSTAVESLCVMVWRENKEESAQLRKLRALCAVRGVYLWEERDIRAFRARFWDDVEKGGWM